MLLVHGFFSSNETWNNAELAFAAELPNRAPAAKVSWFDYKDYATRWVTDPNIGPELAKCIVRLAAEAKASDGTLNPQVIVVGHSMGGLAIRCALAPSCNGNQPDIAASVGLVVTIGTPNLGSGLRSDRIDSYALTTGGRALGAACSNPGLAGGILRKTKILDWCDTASGFFGSHASLAFTADSDELRDLPPIDPNGPPVLAIAGEVRIPANSGLEHIRVVRLFHHLLPKPADPSLGDLVVGVQSALVGGTPDRPPGGILTLSCGTLPPKPACTHVSETRTEQFLVATAAAVNTYANDHPPPQPAPPSPDPDWQLLAVKAAGCQTWNGWEGSRSDFPVQVHRHDFTGEGSEQVWVEFQCPTTTSSNPDFVAVFARRGPGWATLGVLGRSTGSSDPDAYLRGTTAQTNGPTLTMAGPSISGWDALAEPHHHATLVYRWDGHAFRRTSDAVTYDGAVSASPADGHYEGRVVDASKRQVTIALQQWFHGADAARACRHDHVKPSFEWCTDYYYRQLPTLRTFTLAPKAQVRAFDSYTGEVKNGRSLAVLTDAGLTNSESAFSATVRHHRVTELKQIWVA